MKRTPIRKLSTMESFEYARLLGILRRVLWRWRLKVLMRGLALLLVAALVAVSAASWGVDAARYRPWIVLLLGLLTYGMLAYAAYRFVIRPLSRRVTDRQVALYLEENADLRAALLSAVEFGALRGREIPKDVSSQFVSKVVEDAVRRGRKIDYGKDVETGELRKVGSYLAVAAVTVAAVLFVNPAFLRHGLPALFRPFAGADVETPYSIVVLPGTLDVARGSDQVLSAALGGFSADVVEVSYRIGDGDWGRQRMVPNLDNGRHEFMLFRVAGDVEYFVEAAAVRSDVYRLTVVDRPHVARIDLELRFPDYSGLSPQTIDDGGDIAALAGTRATITVTPTVQVPEGRIVVEFVAGEGQSEMLALRGEGHKFVGMLTVGEPGYYRIELRTPEGEWIDASSDYLIEVLNDQPPLILFDRPGRDVEVTSVEEVFTEVTVEDDFGIEKVELVWTLNGGDEQRVRLFSGPGRGEHVRKDVTGAHTFYLEEFELEPGDFIAYWAEATDNRSVDRPQTVATDMYFVEIRPFEREFRQADAGGQGRGGPQESGLADQQRRVVSATFKIVRDGRLITGSGPGPSGTGTRGEDLEFLAQMEEDLQAKAREASAMAGSMGGDADTSVTAVEYLGEAAVALGEAAELLHGDQPGEALPVEQRALRFLQRFDALFRRIQVSWGQQGGGGAGGADMEAIADMFDLGMDELENQYESVRRGQQEEVDDAVDEAAQRLKELARRQQQELERQRANQTPGGGAGRNSDQRAIADEAEQLARELQRLSRENSRPDLRDAANRLQQAADSMRRAAARSGQQGAAEGTRALNKLQNARRLLEDMREGRLDRDLAQARESLADMRKAQAQIERQVDRLGEPGGRTSERIDGLMERKDALADDIRDLETQLDDMARESRRDQMRTSRDLQEAAEWMRDSKLADKVRYSKGVVQERDARFAAGFEREISEDLASLETRLAAAEDSVQKPESERLSAALDDTRDLVRRLESFENRMRDMAEGGEEGRGREGNEGTQEGQGQQARQGQGQPGQGQSQQRGGPANGGRVGGSTSGVPGRRQMAREFRERLNDAEALREALAREGVQVTDLDDVIAAMRDFDGAFTGTTRGLDKLRDDVIDGLKLFEFWLRRVTDASSGERPQLAGSDRVPEGYRDLVEEYFRSLAREPDPSGSQR